MLVVILLAIIAGLLAGILAAVNKGFDELSKGLETLIKSSNPSSTH